VRIVHRDFPHSSIDAVQASLDLISAASKGGDWQAMRRIYLVEGIAPETRIKALAASGVEVTNDDRAKASDTMAKSKALAEKAGVTGLPAIIVVVGGKVQALTGPQSKDAILAAIASVRKAAAQ
jgi:protein-disulfide isomerase-like protein with CxxC motif